MPDDRGEMSARFGAFQTEKQPEVESREWHG